jgi:hypothetical protein
MDQCLDIGGKDGGPLSPSSIANNCVCGKVVPNVNTLHCGICHNTILPLFERHREKMSLLDQMDMARRDLEMERGKALMHIRENQKLLTRVKELEEALDFQVEQAITLREDMQVLSDKLVKEAESRAEIQADRDKLNDELEDLSSKLFEEANEMVKDERKKNHELEMSKLRVSKQLEKTKSKWEMGKSEVITLQRKLSHLSVTMRKNSDRPPSAAAITLKSPTDNQEGDNLDNNIDDVIINSSPVKGEIRLVEAAADITTTIDTFSSIDAELLPDRRLFDDFRSFADRCQNVPVNKLSQLFPVFKQWVEDFVEPCARLGKLSSKKVMDAIIQNTLRISDTSQQSHMDHQRRSATGSPERVSTPDPNDLSNQNQHPHQGISASVSNSSLKSLTGSSADATRAASPVKMLWKEFTTGVSMSNHNLCGGCGREVKCDYMIKLLPLTNAASSSAAATATGGSNNGSVGGLHHNNSSSSLNAIASSSNDASSSTSTIPTNGKVTEIYIDLWCRDRVYAVYEFYDYVVHLTRGTAMHIPGPSGGGSTNDALMEKSPDLSTELMMEKLFVQFLRRLKNMFYARLGVMSYFRAIEKDLAAITDISGRSDDAEEDVQETAETRASTAAKTDAVLPNGDQN